MERNIKMNTQTRANRILNFLKRSLISVTIFIFALAITGMIYQTAATETDQRKYPPPGILANVDGYKMHIYCLGEGTPTVILDSANMGTVSNWTWIQPEVAKTARVCAYDRADSGWSDLSPQPNDTRQNAETLHTLLNNAGESGPFVLVGHSFGGLYVRMFAEMYPDEVVGIVFIEGTLPDGLNRLGKPDVMPNAPDAQMMDATPFISRLGILRLVGFPATDLDLPEQQRNELQAYLSSTKLAESIKRQYHLFPTLLAQVRPLYEAGSLGDIPVAVVLGSEGDGGIPEWHDLFAGQAALSTNHIMVTVDGANHISLVDRQEHALQTSAVILKVIEAVRSGQPLQ
jgi:pimeloyl-ACP methyl ester carboxylesterase